MLAHNIRELFVKMGYKWAFIRDRERVLDTPTVDDVESAVESMASRLDNNTGSWVESGRILIKNDVDVRDVYVYMGTIDKENDSE